ncbi:MAG: nitroreductase family protein [Acidobacteria bacterium]|nr:nitroreductase family protein [Acidobacteriota bacterium]
MGLDWRRYHEATKHTPERLRRTAHALDWDNMPNPFRHYEGVPVFDLPADPAAPEIAAWDVLRGCFGTEPAADAVQLLSQLLFYSASISATKVVPSTGYRYALRVNPSSGNLHPTEFHFATRGLDGWPDGLYHYRPSQHMAEQRGRGDFGFAAPITVVLTTIAWREAWKYGDRAYRYCLLDIGHAWEAVELSGRAMGWRCSVVGSFDDGEVAARLGAAPDEWPMLILELDHATTGIGGGASDLMGGTPNELSDSPELPELIEPFHEATCGPGPEWRVEQQAGSGQPMGGRAFGETVRGRRSALDFVGGDRTMTFQQFIALLSVATVPWITVFVYVHRVAGLAPGVYKYTGDLELIRAGDQRVAAAGLSLGQGLAGNACAAFSIIADLEGVTARYGDRGYRYAHFAAGALGQRLYIAAGALGLGATGIGAFFDDRVNSYLHIDHGQVIYHFAVGYPVQDERLEA